MAGAWSIVEGGRAWRDEGDGCEAAVLNVSLEPKQMRADLYRFRPGARMEYHDHGWQEELYYVVTGEATLVADGERRALKAGDLVRLAPQPRRQIVNESAEDCVWFAVGAPPVDDDWHEYPEGSPSDPAAPEGSWAVASASSLDEKTRDRYLITWLTEPLGLQQLRANLFRFRRGDSMYLHAHKSQEELFLVVSGEAELVVGDERRRVGPLDVVRVDPAPPRQLIQAGDEETVWLALGAPPVGDDTIWTEE